MQKIVVILICFVFLKLSVPVFAAETEKFSPSYDISYKISETGEAHSVYSAHIQNLTSDYFPTDFTLKISSIDIANVKATDRLGPLKLTVQNIAPQQYLVNVKFNDEVVGKNNILNWTLSFDSQEIASKSGRLWQVHLPPLPIGTDFDNSTISVNVPQIFGLMVLSKPTPNLTKHSWRGKSLENGVRIFYSPNDRLADSAYQTYGFQLRYNLKNAGLFSVFQTITLPPDTNYQKIFLTGLDPKPSSTTLDLDGNVLARYYLPPRTKLSISARGLAAVSPIPIFNYESPVSEFDLSSQKYWETGASEFKALNPKFKKPGDIFDFVVDTLSYDKTKIGSGKRLGAVGALQNPASAVCLEFTDLLVALFRQNKIPAREVDGFGFTAEGTLHSWVEYFDSQSQSWVMVDPTWQKTTKGMDYWTSLDFNHLALAIHGQNSVQPLPAGSFNNAVDNSKLLTVTPLDKNLDLNSLSDLTITFDNSQSFLSGRPIKIGLKIENKGPTITPFQKIIISSRSLRPKNQTKTVPALAPFEKRQIYFTFETIPWYQSADDIITVSLNDKSETVHVLVSPFFKNPIYLLLLTFGTVGFLSLVAQITRRLHFQKRR